MLQRFLTTDSIDVGCAETFALLDLYVERQFEQGDAALVFPGIAAHLSRCRPCIEDFDGLMAALASDSY